MPNERSAHLSIEMVRTFIAVAETGSLSKVAAKLDITQPAVTIQMRKLEIAVGAPLLKKTLGGTALTEVGRSALAPARRAVEAIEQLLSLNRSSSGDHCIRLGISALLLPKLLKDGFTAKFPKVTLISDHSSEIRRGLAEGLIDIGCGFASESGLARLDNWILERIPIPFAWARAKTFFPLPGAKVPVIGLLDDENFIVPMRNRGINFEVVLQTSDLHLKFEAVRAGIGLCVAPAALIPADLVVAKESYLPKLDPLDACVCCRPTFDTPGLAAIISTLRDFLLAQVQVGERKVNAVA